MNIQFAPKLPQSAFAERRAKLVSQMPDNSIAILATATSHIRNGDAEYKYRADSSFFYLTGFAEPDSIMVLEKVDGKAKYTLLLRPKDKLREIWDGKRAGVAGAKTDYLADDSLDISLKDDLIPQMLLGKSHIFARFSPPLIAWLATASHLKRGEGVPTTVQNIDSVINEMRLIKDAAEIALLQTACDLSALGHIRAMQALVNPSQPVIYEYQLEAVVNHAFGEYGCVPAYTSIVAGGDNANILHYIENDQPLNAGDLVMIDAGAEYQYYAGDISRTFPVSGKFSAEQAEVYDLVLQANLAAIDSLKIGKSCKIHHETAVRILTEGLVNMGILAGEVETLVKDQAYLPFYMHGTGHWLGMDVHDVGSYLATFDATDTSKNVPRPLQAGMVMTVEPGLYFAHDNPLVPEKYRGIGIRIEDDVLITENGAKVLTANAPKTIADIVALMARK